MDAVYDAFLGAGNNIRQVMRTGYGPNANVIAAFQSGDISPSQFYGGNVQETIQIESMDLDGAISAISPTSGLRLTADVITLPFRRRANGGTFASGGAHFTLSATDGFVAINQISGTQDNEGVTAVMGFLPLSSDGFTDPVSTNKNQTLAAQAFNVQYDFGPAYFNSVQVPRMSGWVVDTGVAIRSRRFDGTIFPTEHYIVRAVPTITLLFEELDDVNDVFSNLFASMTTCAVYARKRNDGGTHVADVTTAHCKFSFATGISQVEQISVGEDQNAQVGIRLHGKALSVTSASAIP